MQHRGVRIFENDDGQWCWEDPVAGVFSSGGFWSLETAYVDVDSHLAGGAREWDQYLRRIYFIRTKPDVGPALPRAQKTPATRRDLKAKGARAESLEIRALSSAPGK